MTSSTSGVDNSTGVSFASGQGFYDHVLTNFFLPVYADARNNSSVLWSLLQKTDKSQVSGRYIIWPVRTTRNPGRGAMRVGGNLPDPGAQGWKSQFTETRTYFARVKIDGETMRRGKTNGGAWVEATEIEVQGQAEDLQVDMNRWAHNDGSGRLCEITSISTVTATLRVNQSIEGATNCPTAPTIYLEIGDRIGFYTPGTDVMRSNSGQIGFYVLTLPTTGTMTVSLSPGGAAFDLSTTSPAAVAVGDWVVRVTSDTPTGTAVKSTGARCEPMGIAGIYSDAGTLDGLGAVGSQQSGAVDTTGTSNSSANFQGNAATSANPWNQAVVLDNGAGGTRAITEALMQQALSNAEERNNAPVDVLLSAYNTYNSYVQLLTPDKRFNDTLDLKGGHKVLSFNGIGWVKDRFCYGGRVYFLGLSELQAFEVEQMGPLTAMGVTKWERLKDTDAYWSGVVGSYNIGTNVRQRVGAVLVDLSA